MTNALLDANTLIAALDESHASHGQARAFLESVSAFYTDPGFSHSPSTGSFQMTSLLAGFKQWNDAYLIALAKNIA